MGDESNVVSIAAWFALRASAERAAAGAGPATGGPIQLPVGQIVQIKSRRGRGGSAEPATGPGSGTAA